VGRASFEKRDFFAELPWTDLQWLAKTQGWCSATTIQVSVYQKKLGLVPKSPRDDLSAERASVPRDYLHLRSFLGIHAFTTFVNPFTAPAACNR